MQHDMRTANTVRWLSWNLNAIVKRTIVVCETMLFRVVSVSTSVFLSSFSFLPTKCRSSRYLVLNHLFTVWRFYVECLGTRMRDQRMNFKQPSIPERIELSSLSVAAVSSLLRRSCSILRASISLRNVVLNSSLFFQRYGSLYSNWEGNSTEQLWNVQHRCAVNHCEMIKFLLTALTVRSTTVQWMNSVRNCKTSQKSRRSNLIELTNKSETHNHYSRNTAVQFRTSVLLLGGNLHIRGFER